jgi:lipopolysaccharide/colanic/teichoic acid biosynthesis glycosyltransferase
MIFEYLVDNINFRKRVPLFNSLIYSLIINTLFFSIYWSFTKKPILLYMIAGFTLLQMVVKEILMRIFIKKKSILFVGEEDELIKIREDFLKNYSGVNIETVKDFDDLEKVVSEKGIEEVVFFQYADMREQSEEIIKLRTQGIKFTDHLKFIEKYEGKIAIKEINNEWVISTDGFGIFHDNIQKRVKRLFDLFLAVLVAIPALPLMLFAYVVTKIEIPEVNPIYSQIRIGLGGEPFKMYKFRSMKPHDPKLSLEEKAKYVTKFGNFMRKTRIDELPQLINVFRGEISFVGPRAEWDRLHEEYAKNIPYYYLRQTVKPGLTGWAQVMHTHGEGIEHSLEKFEYDLYYIKYQNLVLDIIIFFKTVKTVIFGKGK